MISPWARAQEFVRVVSPLWLATLIVGALAGALFVPQIREVLMAASSDPRSGFSQKFFLGVAVVLTAISAWYFSRGLLYARYWNSAVPETPGEQERYFRYKIWAPRILGLAVLAPPALVYLLEGYLIAGGIYLGLTLAFLVFVLVRSRVFEVTRPSAGRDRMPRFTFMMLSGILFVSLVLLVIFSNFRVSGPQFVGTAAILYFAAASWIGFGSLAVVYLSRRYRVPVIGFLILAALLFGFVNKNHQIGICEGQKHGHRNCGDDLGPSDRPLAADFLRQWLDHRKDVIEEYRARGEPYPVFVVAAEGGGVRAAYWTGSVLTTLQDRERRFACHTFAVSGVSGGSLGAAMFAGLVTEARDEAGADLCADGVGFGRADFAARGQAILGQDFLAPVSAGLLYTDLAQRFLPTAEPWALPDRARFLEESWEVAWRREIGNRRFSEPFRLLWTGDRRYEIPSLFLNTTSVDDGSRAVVSNLRPVANDPDTGANRFVDLEDVLDIVDRSIPMSTATHLSARFPFVSPAGVIGYKKRMRMFVDGGYSENSGALTASEIVDMINATPEARDGHIEPVAILIRNSDLSGTTFWPWMRNSETAVEIVAPIKTMFGARMAHAELAVMTLKAQLPDSHVVEFQLDERAAVPLGWMLSAETEAKMQDLAGHHPGLQAVGAHLSR